MPDNTDVTIETPNAASQDPGERDRAIQTGIDRFVVHIANTTAWLFPLLIIAICTQVIARKMGNNQAWLDDAQWWIYGFAMTVGFVYAITTQSHVRVDILHAGFSDRKKARIEVFGLGWLLLPFLVIMFDVLTHYGWASVVSREGSDSPNGLHRLYLLKMSLAIVFALAIVASFSILKRHLSVIAPVRIWTILLAAFPTAWLIAERLCHYVFWWYVKLSNTELSARKVSKDPLLEYSFWCGFALVTVCIVFSFSLNQRRNQG